MYPVTLVPTPPPTALEPFEMLHAAEQVANAFLLGYVERTRSAYQSDLRAFFTWCSAHDLNPLAASRAHVDAFARQCGEIDGLSSATVARRLSALAGYYRYALSEDLVDRSPVEHVKRPKVGSETTSTGLDRDELHELLAVASADGPRTQALVLLLALNGLRVSEALSTNVQDLATERGHHVVKITRKGGKRQTVPLAPRTAEAISTLIAERTSGPIFSTSTGKPMDRPAVWRTLRRLARQAVPAKAGSIHPHDLRHAFVTLSLDTGASLRDVQDAAGHADPRTTRRYDRARYNLDKHPTYALAGIV